MPLRVPVHLSNTISHLSLSLSPRAVSGPLHTLPASCSSQAHVSSLSSLSDAHALDRLHWFGNRIDCRGGQSGAGRARSRPFISMASATGAPSQTMPSEKVDEETKYWEQIQAHQKGAARLSHVEEARTLLDRSLSGTLSTISEKYDGYPVGSMVAFAADEQGRPILAISSLSPHTKDLEVNPRCSLLVPRDPLDKSDTIVTIIGEAETVSEQDWAAVRAAYMKRHPDAFWVDFGDFRLVRIEPKKVKFLTGSVTAFAAFGDFTGEEYKAAAVDPIAQFTTPIAGHMNRDHGDETRQIVENSVGVKVDYAKILQVDHLGFNVQAAHKGIPLKLRIPFPRPADDRKDVKNLIVEMTQLAANTASS